jgi:hypothetical protein
MRKVFEKDGYKFFFFNKKSIEVKWYDFFNR